jgi:hypothetical protein
LENEWHYKTCLNDVLNYKTPLNVVKIHKTLVGLSGIACLLTCPTTHPCFCLTSLFPDKKFPAVEAHFCLDELFYYIDV